MAAQQQSPQLAGIYIYNIHKKDIMTICKHIAEYFSFLSFHITVSQKYEKFKPKTIEN